MKARPVLSFGSLASSLAKSQTQHVISQMQDANSRLTCQMTLIPSPAPPATKVKEPYLAASTAEVEYMEAQLLAGEFRLMVQRAADLVLPLREGLTCAAVPARDTPFDALLNREGLIADDLPEGSKIGVLNLRTKAQMHTLWPRLKIMLLPGGLDTALELFLRRGAMDGLVLPAAAAEHLGIQGIVTEIFYPEMMLPSSGQGILVIMARTADKEAIELLQAIHSEATFLEMEAEHAFMARFASDQDLPVSALAQVERDHIRITGAIGSVHGSSLNRMAQEGPAVNAVHIGSELATKLLTSSDAVIDLLEADFPDGLPHDDADDSLEEDEIDDLDLTAEIVDDLTDDDLPNSP